MSVTATSPSRTSEELIAITSAADALKRQPRSVRPGAASDRVVRAALEGLADRMQQEQAEIRRVFEAEIRARQTTHLRPMPEAVGIVNAHQAPTAGGPS
jgi:hypothetical protein